MAQHPGIPWDQRPDYLALTQRVDPAGIVTAYNPPRPGVSATDVTSFVYGQVDSAVSYLERWSLTASSSQATITTANWPEIMYYLHPLAEWTAFRSTPRPPQKVDANGQPMVERFPAPGQPPRPLLDFPVLPDTICSEEFLWWIELWRRMDPRIKWADILMRIEVPNHSVTFDRKLQNSTNNLINRHEHRRYNMLAWHTTGANSMRTNEVRRTVLARVAAAQPPLPPNSTRGLTPGLINPQLGNVPGNVVPQPVTRNGLGRLRVGGRQANPPQLTQAQPGLTQNNQGRKPRVQGNRVPSKRRHSSEEDQGQRPKRQTQNPNDNTEEDDMEIGSDASESVEETPSSFLKTPRTQGFRIPKVAKPKTVIGKAKRGGIKKKPKPKNVGTAKKDKRSTVHQQQVATTESELSELESDAQDNEAGDSSVGTILYPGDPGFEDAFQASRRARRPAQNVVPVPTRQHGPRRPPRQAYSELDDNAQNNEVRDSSAGPILYEDDPGFEDAFQASRQARRPAQDAGPIHRPDPHLPPRRARPPPSRALARAPEIIRSITDHVSDSELLGDSEGSTLVSETQGDVEESTLVASSPMRSRRPTVRSSRVPQSRGVRITEDNEGHAVVTRQSSAASVGLPVAPANRPPPSYYTRRDDGSHVHYVDGSGLPGYVTHPPPSSNPRYSFTPSQRAQVQAQANAQQDSQPAAQTPAVAPTGRGNPNANRTSRLAAEAARHNNALSNEMARRERIERNELGRHTRAVREILREDSFEYGAGFVEREDERERRERLGDSDED